MARGFPEAEKPVQAGSFEFDGAVSRILSASSPISLALFAPLRIELRTLRPISPASVFRTKGKTVPA
jgi:hypothetical protein